MLKHPGTRGTYTHKILAQDTNLYEQFYMEDFFACRNWRISQDKTRGFQPAEIRGFSAGPNWWISTGQNWKTSTGQKWWIFTALFFSGLNCWIFMLVELC